MSDRLLIALTLTASVLLATSPSRATPVFSQTGTRISGGSGSDRALTSNGLERATSFILASSATARTATWRGSYFTRNATVLPLQFALTFYADAGGLPDAGAILGRTSVQFNARSEFVDTGIDAVGLDIFEFAADLDPVSLPADDRVWFSVLADTGNTFDNHFFWTTTIKSTVDSSDIAERRDVRNAGPFTVAPIAGAYYFILGDGQVPEPAMPVAGLAIVFAALQRYRSAKRSGT